MLIPIHAALFYDLTHGILLTSITICFWYRNPFCHLIYIEPFGTHYLLDWQGTPSRYSDQTHISHVSNVIDMIYAFTSLFCSIHWTILFLRWHDCKSDLFIFQQFACFLSSEKDVLLYALIVLLSFFVGTTYLCIWCGS